MKKYLVIGNPIEHSLSPKLHNYWIKINKINAIYEKKKLNESQIKNLIYEVKDKKISGLNVTVPFKQKVIPYLDEITPEAKETQSVNTIYLGSNGTVGDNTDIDGFQASLADTGLVGKSSFDFKDKDIFILGAGGVVPSIIFALTRLKAKSIIISNRTRQKAENLKKIFHHINIVDWGVIPNFDMIINATSIGLKIEDRIDFDFSNVKNKFFYDVIYNPSETNFLKTGKKFSNKICNGKWMFIYQAYYAFKIWHNFFPIIDDDVIKLLNDD